MTIAASLIAFVAGLPLGLVLVGSAPGGIWEQRFDFPDSPLSQALRQPLMLGLFLPIQAGGLPESHIRGTNFPACDETIKPCETPSDRLRAGRLIPARGISRPTT